jgi:hypothetical protein
MQTKFDPRKEINNVRSRVETRIKTYARRISEYEIHSVNYPCLPHFRRGQCDGELTLHFNRLVSMNYKRN